MRHTIFSGAQRYTFMKKSDLQAGETPLALTEVKARNVIAAMMQKPKTNQALRNLLKEVSAFAVLAKLGDKEVSAQLVKRLVSGDIKVIVAGAAAAAGQKKNADEPQAGKAEPPPKVSEATAEDAVHWIKFKVVDEKDKLLEGIKLNLAFSGKDPKTHGAEGGFLHLKNLKPGTCDVKAVESKILYEVIEFKG